MSAATPIKNAMNELEVTIRNLSSYPETDKTADTALHAATAARAFMRAALEAATKSDTQATGGQPIATPGQVPDTLKRQTADHPFFPCNARKDRLFSVNEGIPPADALGQASLFLDSAQAITSNADDAVPEMIFGAAYLIEMAKAVVDATVRAIYAEEAAGAK